MVALVQTKGLSEAVVEAKPQATGLLVGEALPEVELVSLPMKDISLQDRRAVQPESQVA
jgi:hypothetical protein